MSESPFCPFRFAFRLGRALVFSAGAFFLLGSPVFAQDPTPTPALETPVPPSTADAATEDTGSTKTKSELTILETPLAVEDPDSQTPPPQETAILLEEEGPDGAQAEATVTEEPGEPTAEGQADLIPLPEEAIEDLELLDLPMDTGPTEGLDDFVMPSDLPEMEVAPALPSIPIGEPARVIDARYKALRIKIDKDPEVLSLKKQADAAKTYEGNRAALREYYRLLFKKMRAADDTLETRISTMEQAYLNRLAQTRLEPTIPLEPPPKPRPLE
jgi:hypothetical protein